MQNCGLHQPKSLFTDMERTYCPEFVEQMKFAQIPLLTLWTEPFKSARTGNDESDILAFSSHAFCHGSLKDRKNCPAKERKSISSLFAQSRTTRSTCPSQRETRKPCIETRTETQFTRFVISSSSPRSIRSTPSLQWIYMDSFTMLCPKKGC